MIYIHTHLLVLRWRTAAESYQAKRPGYKSIVLVRELHLRGICRGGHRVIRFYYFLFAQLADVHGFLLQRLAQHGLVYVCVCVYIYIYIYIVG